MGRDLRLRARGIVLRGLRVHYDALCVVPVSSGSHSGTSDQGRRPWAPSILMLCTCYRLTSD